VLPKDNSLKVLAKLRETYLIPKQLDATPSAKPHRHLEVNGFRSEKGTRPDELMLNVLRCHETY